MKQPHHPVMADSKVNYAGEPVAMVIAESIVAAKNAAERVAVDYTEMDAVVSVSSAQ